MNKKINLVKNILFSNFKRLNSAYKLTFALTYRCNLKCKTCNIWQNSPEEEMNILEIEKIFKNLKNLSWLDLTGGEITLREDLIEIVKRIIKNAKKLLIFHISTNGQLSNEVFALAGEILKAGMIPVINVSVEAPGRLDDKLRGVEGSYSKSLETFKLLKKLHKGYYYLSCTISNYNIDYIDELLSELKKEIFYFTPSDLHFNVFSNSSHYYKNQNMAGLATSNLKNLKKYLMLSKKGNFIKKFLEDRYIKVLIKSFKEDRYPLKCQALKSACFISPYGEVYPCTGDNRIIGNLKDYDYDLNKIWNEPYTMEVRRDIEHYNCHRCLGTCEVYPSMLGDIGKTLFV